MDLDLKLVSKEINELMWRDCKTLSTAESCTAGRIASVITAVPGSSNYYKGGLICYHLRCDSGERHIKRGEPGLRIDQVVVLLHHCSPLYHGNTNAAKGSCDADFINDIPHHRPSGPGMRLVAGHRSR